MPKRKCTFTTELQKEFTFLKKGTHDSECFCSHCGIKFSVAHGGRSDITDHVKTGRHQHNVDAKSSKGMHRDIVVYSSSFRRKKKILVLPRIR